MKLVWILMGLILTTGTSLAQSDFTEARLNSLGEIRVDSGQGVSFGTDLKAFPMTMTAGGKVYKAVRIGTDVFGDIKATWGFIDPDEIPTLIEFLDRVAADIEDRSEKESDHYFRCRDNLLIGAVARGTKWRFYMNDENDFTREWVGNRVDVKKLADALRQIQGEF